MQSITLRAGLEPKSRLSVLCAALKLRVRAACRPHLTRDWLTMLNSNPTLSAIAHKEPRLLHKIYRPYLSARLDGRQALNALIGHYCFVLRHGLGATVLQATRGAVELASFTGKSDTRYTLTLRAIVPMEREGELVLQLHCEQTLVLSCAFSFFSEQGKASVGVGCLQGPQCGEGLALTREATRDLHGLRPKNLMLRLVRQLGYAYGCEQLVLVGNGNRAVARQLRKGRVHADYDGLWEELGAQRRADGDYALACTALAPLDLAEIPSKKRSEARKRQQLLEDVCEAMLVHIVPRDLTHQQESPLRAARVESVMSRRRSPCRCAAHSLIEEN